MEFDDREAELDERQSMLQDREANLEERENILRYREAEHESKRDALAVREAQFERRLREMPAQEPPIRERKRKYGRHARRAHDQDDSGSESEASVAYRQRKRSCGYSPSAEHRIELAREERLAKMQSAEAVASDWHPAFDEDMHQRWIEEAHRARLPQESLQASFPSEEAHGDHEVGAGLQQHRTAAVLSAPQEQYGQTSLAHEDRDRSLAPWPRHLDYGPPALTFAGSGINIVEV